MFDGFFHPFNMIFGIFPVLFVLTFVLILGTVIFNTINSARAWNYNDRQPVLTVPAKVIAKRSHISSRNFRHSHDHNHYHDYTRYYVTFEVESGDRMELQMDGRDYGLLVEGDVGRLTFQGTRYIRFERTGSSF